MLTAVVSAHDALLLLGGSSVLRGTRDRQGPCACAGLPNGPWPREDRDLRLYTGGIRNGRLLAMKPVHTGAFGITNTVANPVLIPFLRSRLGAGLGRHLAVVEYVGRRTGQVHRLVTQYSLDGTKVHIQVGEADRKTWWRNFRSPAPVHLRLAGVDHEGTAVAVKQGEQVVLEALLGDRSHEPRRG